MDSLSAIPDSVDSKASAGRVDFRNLQTVTIDGEDAKDLDDAISISKIRMAILLACISRMSATM